MRIVVSIFSSDIREYNDLIAALKGHYIGELICVKNSLVRRYSKEFNKPLQEFEINWQDLRGVQPQHIGEDKWGNPYNKRAAHEAAEKAVEYGEAMVIVGQGNFHINALGKKKGLKLLNNPDPNIQKPEGKKFKF